MRLRQTGVAIVVMGLATSSPVSASPVSDQALVESLLRLAPGLPALELPQADDGKPLSKTVRRADGLSLSVFAGGLVNSTDRTVQQAFSAHANRLLAPLLVQLPPVAASSPTAPGFVEYRLASGGVQLLLAWRSDEPFINRSAALVRTACEQAISPWDPGPVPDAAPTGLYRRQLWSLEVAGQHYERISEWEVRAATATPYWVLMNDRCNTRPVTAGATR